MSAVIIDYGSGNLRSAAKALARAANSCGYAGPIKVTSKPDDVALADRIILPGVGAFADCMKGLSALRGMIEALEGAVLEKGRPFLGICVGMQLMATRGLEHGANQGLGWIEGEVVAIEPTADRKVPHMGWNDVSLVESEEHLGGHPVLEGLQTGTHVYFVHSYHFRLARQKDLLASVDYGDPLAAVVGRDNLIGTQFHPEKSQGPGLRLLGNFLRWSP
jgi:glutamine amidotransferase